MQEEKRHTLKMDLKNGHVIVLYCREQEIVDLTSHPKFLRMADNNNDVYVSIEDVAAFEILSDRKPDPKPEQTEDLNAEKPQ